MAPNRRLKIKHYTEEIIYKEIARKIIFLTKNKRNVEMYSTERELVKNLIKTMNSVDETIESLDEDFKSIIQSDQQSSGTWCEICRRSFKITTSDHNGSISHQQRLKYNPESYKFNCIKCRYGTDILFSFNNHLKSKKHTLAPCGGAAPLTQDDDSVPTTTIQYSTPPATPYTVGMPTPTRIESLIN